MKKQLTVTAVVDYFGGEGPFSIAMNVSREAVKRWQRKKAFPSDQAIWVEVLSDGNISRHMVPVEDWQKEYLGEHYGPTRGQLLDRSVRLERATQLLGSLAARIKAKFESTAA